MRPKKPHHLWTVFTGHEPVAVVAATKPEDAWKIVMALYERNDLKGEPTCTRVLPCTRPQAKRVLKQADSLGVNRFMARLSDGVFMTRIGGLAVDSIAA